jgi:hypothetical protein
MGGEDKGSTSKTGVVGGSAPVQGLTITTASLPAGQPGSTYPTTALATVNAAGSVTWGLAAGVLPPGIALSTAGVLSGTPVTPGFFSLTFRASSGTQSANRTLGLSVGVFGMVATSGLLEGKAWTGVPVTVTCSGATGDVRFEVVSSGSSGAYGPVDPAGGSAIWYPGTLGGSGRSDVLRAVDTASGAQAHVAFEVRTDPTASHAAEFGRTDVWYVDPSPKVGTHGFATDFHSVLATAGLRQASSTSADGAPCDRLAEMCVRLALLRHLNVFYLRNADGSQGEAGLLVSFPYRAPPGHERPVPGTSLDGRSDRYSVISLLHGTRQSVVGTAFLDGETNPLHENNTTAPGAGELGVFANQFVSLFNMTYNNWELTERPITAGDVPALEAVLYGQSLPAGRAEAIRAAIDGLGRSVAAVAAHEIGHSLGLSHTAPSEPGSIMNATGVVSPSASYRFTDADQARLRARLPGLGRFGPATAKPGASGQVAASSLPEGGIQVCGEAERCNLRLAPCPCCAHGHHGHRPAASAAR